VKYIEAENKRQRLVEQLRSLRLQIIEQTAEECSAEPTDAVTRATTSKYHPNVSLGYKNIGDAGKNRSSAQANHLCRPCINLRKNNRN